jgi:hypothetical protein
MAFHKTYTQLLEIVHEFGRHAYSTPKLVIDLIDQDWAEHIVGTRVMSSREKDDGPVAAYWPKSSEGTALRGAD